MNFETVTMTPFIASTENLIVFFCCCLMDVMSQLQCASGLMQTKIHHMKLDWYILRVKYFYFYSVVTIAVATFWSNTLPYKQQITRQWWYVCSVCHKQVTQPSPPHSIT